MRQATSAVFWLCQVNTSGRSPEIALLIILALTLAFAASRVADLPIG